MAWKRNPVFMSLFSRDSRKPQQLCALCPISLLIWSVISLLKIVCYFPNVPFYKNVFRWQRILTHYELKCESINKFYLKLYYLEYQYRKKLVTLYESSGCQEDHNLSIIFTTTKAKHFFSIVWFTKKKKC